MHVRLYVSFTIALFPAMAGADALADLRAALGRLAATTPVHGSLEVTSASRYSEDDKSDDGKADIGFEVGEAGLHITYRRATLAQAEQEARGQARDPERLTPVRSGLRDIRPLQVSELLDGAAALNVLLESAQLVEAKSASYRGRPARLILLKLTPKLSKADGKHLKKLDSTLSIWLDESGIPVAAEQSTYAKASFLLMTFENDRKQSWTYARAGDRLVVTRHEESNKSDGLGQHSSTRTTEVIKIE